MYDLNDVPIYDLNMFRRYKTSNVYQQIVRSRWFWDSSIFIIWKFYAIPKMNFEKYQVLFYMKENLVKLTTILYRIFYIFFDLLLASIFWRVLWKFLMTVRLLVESWLWTKSCLIVIVLRAILVPFLMLILLCKFPILVNTMSCRVLFNFGS